MSNANTLPNKIDTSIPSWRIAGGQLKRGRQGEEQTTDAVLGYLDRITIFYGETPDGDRYGKLEITLDTNTGKQSVTASLCSPTNPRPVISSVKSLGESILYANKGELVQIEARQSSKPNKFNSYSTYAKVTRFNDDLKPLPREAKPGWDYNPCDYEFSEDGIEDILEDIRKHPAYAERDGYGPEKAFNDWARDSGWPYVHQCQSEYLVYINKALKTKFNAVADIQKQDWDRFLDMAKKARSIPEPLVNAVNKPVDGEEDYDPFADE